ncbi:FAD-binding oxidoreductase [Xinfangfangia sp. D13-10-4-6]|uniref:NAD(P)/FAD-dependent oxidoreductase n=1 Tax=Pseudogemmobacter hezensis TaxID=2737662 RepID=UPI001552D93C|nr:FAD-binding oxidoreductase [Pseudogemmobacter hezensis]NPD16206.1 FAD-binding oxidoreductase [Pseudogemmobacter hezensis]
MNLLHANDRAGHYPDSWYAATRVALEAFPKASGEIRADVCVVGAGYTGLSAALHLAQKGLSVVVLEAHRVGFGASGRNGGQVGSGQRQDQDWLENVAGKANARKLWDLAQDAKALVRDLAAGMEGVDYRPGIAHGCWKQSEVDHAKAYAEKLARDYDYHEVEPLDRAGIRALVGSEAFRGGDIDRGAGHIHALNFVIGLAKRAAALGVRIYEESEVTRLIYGEKPVAEAAQARVICDHMVLAVNGYVGPLEPKIAARVMPINNFVIATEPLGAKAKEVLAEPIAVHDTKFVVNYWRLSHDDRLIFGGAESYGYRFPDVAKVVRKPLLEIYPQLAETKIDYAWGGTLAITVNRMPCFARPAKNVFSASGYSGHGVALATLAGKLMAGAIADQASTGFDLIADLPHRRFPGGQALRWPLLVTAMTWFSLRDRLGL